MNRKIEKAVFGLRTLLERNNKQHLISIDKDKIVVNVNQDEYWWVVLIMVLFAITPVIISLYYLFTENDDSSFFLSLVWLFLFSSYIYKIYRGNNILVINFRDRCFEVESANTFLKKIFGKRKVMFSELAKVSMKEQSLKNGYRTMRWYELSIYDKNANRTTLLSFDTEFPLSSIGTQVKLITDLILKNIDSNQN